MTNAERVERYIKDAGGTIDDDGWIKGGLTIYSNDIVDWVKKLKYGFYILGGKPRISNWEPSKPEKEREMSKPKVWRRTGETISAEHAKEIEACIEGEDGKIDSEGTITGNINLYSRVLAPWLNVYHADFWLKNGKPQISNWVPPKQEQRTRRFDVRLKGNVTAEGVAESIQNYLVAIGEDDVEVKEIKDDC